MSFLMAADTEERLTPADFSYPMLIHGAERAGSTMATVVLAAELVRAGMSVVWMCAKPMAVRQLQTELGWRRPAEVRDREVSEKNVGVLERSQLVTFYGDAPFLWRSLRSLPDWGERMVVLKNIETTLDAALWHVLQPHRRLILAGNVNRSGVALPIEGWGTTIGFSPWPPSWHIPSSGQPKYVGEMRSGRSQSKPVIIAGEPEK